MEFKKFLVLGSNSFAGSSIVNELISKNYSVLGVSRSYQPSNYLLSYKLNTKVKNFDFSKIDLNLNFSDLKKKISQFEPDVLIDFAGQGMVAESWKKPDQWYITNIVSKVKLHKFLTESKLIKRYLRVSTPEIYGNSSKYLKETFNYRPSTPYAVSHASIDMSLMSFYEQYDFPVIFTRFSNFYGENQHLYRIIPRTILTLLGKREKLTIDGNGKSIRSFIHKDDFCNGILKTLENGSTGQIYHFAAKEYISVIDLIKKISFLMKVDYKNFVNFGPERPGKDFCYKLNCDKAKKKLNWNSKIFLDEGLKRVINWLNNITTINKKDLNYIHKK